MAHTEISMDSFALPRPFSADENPVMKTSIHIIGPINISL